MGVGDGEGTARVASLIADEFPFPLTEIRFAWLANCTLSCVFIFPHTHTATRRGSCNVQVITAANLAGNSNGAFACCRIVALSLSQRTFRWRRREGVENLWPRCELELAVTKRGHAQRRLCKGAKEREGEREEMEGDCD